MGYRCTEFLIISSPRIAHDTSRRQATILCRRRMALKHAPIRSIRTCCCCCEGECIDPIDGCRRAQSVMRRTRLLLLLQRSGAGIVNPDFRIVERISLFERTSFPGPATDYSSQPANRRFVGRMRGVQWPRRQCGRCWGVDTARHVCSILAARR